MENGDMYLGVVFVIWGFKVKVSRYENNDFTFE